MIIAYQESCSLCECEVKVTEEEYFYERDQQQEKIADILNENPIFITNKSTAKKWFRDCGWKYYKGYTFCKSCSDQMEKGYVVMDKFNYLYSPNGWVDLPLKECILNKEQAIDTIKDYGQKEILIKKRALTSIVKYFNHEVEFDSAGYFKAHPETIFNLKI